MAAHIILTISRRRLQTSLLKKFIIVQIINNLQLLLLCFPICIIKYRGVSQLLLQYTWIIQRIYITIGQYPIFFPKFWGTHVKIFRIIKWIKRLILLRCFHSILIFKIHFLRHKLLVSKVEFTITTINLFIILFHMDLF